MHVLCFTWRNELWKKRTEKKRQCILRLQVVLFPLHVPLVWHLLTTDPWISYPIMQVNVIEWGYLVDTPETDPWSGSVGLPQLMASKWENKLQKQKNSTPRQCQLTTNNWRRKCTNVVASEESFGLQNKAVQLAKFTTRTGLVKAKHLMLFFTFHCFQGMNNDSY